ncbi:MAG: hypothetical protein ACK53H_02540, partial [Betaproteobacteria bacterium]
MWNNVHRPLIPGRLGWKDSPRSRRQQVAAAFLGHMGARSSLRPKRNNPDALTAFAEAPQAPRRLSQSPALRPHGDAGTKFAVAIVRYEVCL